MFPRLVPFGCLAALLAASAIACSRADSRTISAIAGDVAARDSSTAPTASSAPPAPQPTPNELGRIPVFEYHLITDKNSVYERTHEGLRRDLEVMYARGYRPISISEMVDKKIDLPAGQSPVVLVFDDASPSQFRYIERNGNLEIDPNTAVGILTAFNKAHPDWRNRAVFCMLPAAQAGRAWRMARAQPMAPAHGAEGLRRLAWQRILRRCAPQATSR